jgi:hypothetical protein
LGLRSISSTSKTRAELAGMIVPKLRSPAAMRI